MERVLITWVSEWLWYEVAKIFIEKGVEIIWLSRTKPDINIKHISVDFIDEESLKQSINKIKEEYIKIDAIINCAWVLNIEKLDKIKYENMENLFKINVFAPVMLVSWLADIIKENWTDIVNVSSTVWLKAYKDQCNYWASKWGIRWVTENFQIEFKWTKTRVIWFHPWGFKSKIFQKATGTQPSLDWFMEPSDIAKFMVSILELPKNMEVSHVVINRK